MRYFHAVNAMRLFTSAMPRRRLRPEEMSDYMLRDIGFIDGRPACGSRFAESDSRSHRLDLLGLTPCAS